MDAVSASVMVLVLIFGLGLSGASYNTCKDTLNSNGYHLTDSQYQSFYEAANDPVNLQYIGTHQSEMSENWAIVTSSGDSLDQSVSNWYSGYISESLIPDSFTVDKAAAEGGIWGDYSGYTSSITVPQRDLEDIFFQQYGPVGKVITDGHGGYYKGEFSSSSPGDYLYTLKHFWADGHTSVLHSRSIPKLVSGDNPKVWSDASYNIDFSVTENDDGSQTVTLDIFRKYYNPDLELKPSFEKEVFNEKFFSKADQPIEEEKGEEVILPLNPDGSVTLPDGTVLLPNEDGTITIGGTDYVPKPGVLSPTDLLKQLLDLQEKLKELEDELKWEKEKEQDKELYEAIDESASEYDGDLMEFVLNSRITQVFPFCLPFDFVRGIKLFSSSPVAPVFDIPFNIPSFGLFPGVDSSIHFDLTEFKEIAVLSRWLSTVGFIFFLIEITPNIVKGAGS